MDGGNRRLSSASLLARSELKGETRARKVEIFLLALTLFSTSALLLLFTTHYLSTGYAAYIDSRAGYITEVTIVEKFPSLYWNGVYGLALRVPGFTEQLFGDWSNEIARQDLFFDCIDTSEVYGNEIYASNSSTIDFDTLVPANITDIATFMGCGSSVDCAADTFTGNMTVSLGATNISNIPSTYTYRYDGQNDVFDIGAMVDGLGNFVFVTHISALQKGYSLNVTVNYQMLLPTPEGVTMTYYFFTDPNDVCPEGGGIGETVEATVSGYVLDSSDNLIDGATVNFLGLTYLTNASGFYNISGTVTEGNYSVIATHPSYDVSFEYVEVTFSNYTVSQNLTMNTSSTGVNDTFITNVYGYVKDIFGVPILAAKVTVGGFSTLTDSSGYYSVYPSLTEANYTIIATQVGYDSNITVYDFTSKPSSVQINMSLVEEIDVSTDNPFATGPYTEQLVSNIQEQAERDGEDYWVSTKSINTEVRRNTFLEDVIGIYNFGSEMNLRFTISPSLIDVLSLDRSSLVIPGNSFGEMPFTIYGTEPLGVYNGDITISGSLDQVIPVTVTIVERRMPVETLLLSADLFKDTVRKGEDLKYRLTLQNLLSDQGYLVDLTTRIKDVNGSTIYATLNQEQEIESTLTLLDSLEVPDDIPNGEYFLDVEAKYLNLISRVKVPFRVTQPIYLYSFLGIPLWTYFLFLSFLSFILLNLFIYKRHLDKKKRYRVAVDYGTLPEPGPRVVKMGHVAETKKDALYEIDKLTVHTIVAGATGMGKSISAQVLIEECLMKNVAVVVFDPTAQWSGMLRKCEDKKMLSFYPKFGLKASDARGFLGNIRAIKDARQIIDINKYVEPGHIQIFTLNKLQPKDMDIFVANVIRQIFKSDPKESPELKLLLVFDEVHRLLPRFGGSGEGFLQIERGCREFRKWGMGNILISQVMNDFVGEIKANINTEIQARTVEEGDLERIKSRYGESFLKSLVKSEVGVSMFQNAEYNRGLPYFINFRPILHNTRRLTDEELDKYNQYNDVVDDLEYQVEQLKELKIDVFDLEMEIKLVKGKIMTGNFSVVDIYLEGLQPRVVKQWQKLGKTPKKKQIELADLDEIKASVAEAKKARDKELAKEKASAVSAKKEVKEDVKKKILSTPLTLDNGAMVSTIDELEGLLPDLDSEVFVLHVNEGKNDIADWFKQVAPNFAAKLRVITDKAKMLELIKGFTVEDKAAVPPEVVVSKKPSQKVLTPTPTPKPTLVKPIPAPKSPNSQIPTHKPVAPKKEVLAKPLLPKTQPPKSSPVSIPNTKTPGGESEEKKEEKTDEK